MSRFVSLEDCDLDEEPPEAEASGTSKPALEEPLFWLDLEMTGLQPREHHILEVALIVSDGATIVPRIGTIRTAKPRAIAAGPAFAAG